MCPGCGCPIAECACAAEGEAPAPSGPAIVGRETKGRGGKCVTVVAGLPLSAADRKALARDLRALCGSGGTVKEGRIEVQGDHRERVAAELEARGFAVRRSG
jgi:translation initiation factor 1